jgi:hypothetical protein
MKDKFVPKFLGKKIDGKFHFDRGEQNRYNAYLYGIREGSEMFLAMGHKNKGTVRSLQQNRYYFGVVVELLSAHTGYTPEEMHEALKIKFLLVKRQGLPDTVMSTARLTKDQFCEYIEKIQRWAATEMGCVIPDPESVMIV